MPELPEVETIVRQLNQKIVGKTIEKVEILDKKLVDVKIKKILPAKVLGVYRRAKSIIIELELKQFLLIHLRMTGHFHYLEKSSATPPDERFATSKFYFQDAVLTHSDIRRFGSIRLMNEEKLEKELAKLGVEPLSKEFTVQKLAELLGKKRKSNIKVVLMDQALVAGIGNIYAQEALYHAGISPLRKVGSLSLPEVKKLHEEIVRILELAVRNNGTTVDNYVHIEGSGGFQKYLAVYGLEKCPQGHKLIKMSLGGRGTSYCPVCQK